MYFPEMTMTDVSSVFLSYVTVTVTDVSLTSADPCDYSACRYFVATAA